MLRFFTFSLLSLSLGLFSLLQSHAQSLDKLKQQAMNTQSLTLTHGDSVEVVQVARTDIGASPAKADRYYWWLRAGEVKSTQGGYAGKLLNGKYALYNRNKDLLENGQYSKGLRVEEWRGWYADGTLRYIESWKDGLLVGNFTEYDKAGNLSREGNYRKGKLHGRVNTYDEKGELTKYHYRNGKQKAEKTKSNRKYSLVLASFYDSLKDKLRLRKKGADTDSASVQVQPAPDSSAANEVKNEKKRRLRLPFGKKSEK